MNSLGVESRGSRRPPRDICITSRWPRRFAGRESDANWSHAAPTALKLEGIEKINFWVKADNAAGLAFWNRIGGPNVPDLVIVSLILSDNPNA